MTAKKRLFFSLNFSRKKKYNVFNFKCTVWVGLLSAGCKRNWVIWLKRRAEIKISFKWFFKKVKKQVFFVNFLKKMKKFNFSSNLLFYFYSPYNLLFYFQNYGICIKGLDKIRYFVIFLLNLFWFIRQKHLFFIKRNRPQFWGKFSIFFAFYSLHV